MATKACVYCVFNDGFEIDLTMMTTVIIGIDGAIGSSGRDWTFTVNE